MVEPAANNPKPVKKITVNEGTSVETVKKHGSAGQKMAINLFDHDKDGKMDASEASLFNNCTFTTGNGSLTIYDRSNSEKNPKVTEIRYGKDPDKVLNNGYNYYDGDLYLDTCKRDDKGIAKDNTGMYYATTYTENGTKTTVDFNKNTVNVQGGGVEKIYTINADLHVKNADIEEINLAGGSANLKNVKDKGLIKDTATKINADGDVKDISADTNSKVDIKRE